MDCYIALGSNLGDRRAHLQAGLEGLRRHGLAPLAISSVWETEPVDTEHPRWFWNMAVRSESRRPPLGLLEALLEIERENGRRRRERNGPRTLDLDLLLVGDLVVDEPRLRLPHPRMWERVFVLEPLAEIAPRLLNPATGRSVAEERDSLVDPARARRLGDLASCPSLPL
jgi:2-amino-4-hydroxy-6-hydroxymethyldihydropteridine diphosphokinase